jgi:conjugal transfer pilus assembly protein TraI
MFWKRLFVGGTANEEVGTDAVYRKGEPRALLHALRSRLSALQLESGYDADQFERLLGETLVRTAEWVHFLPATRAENHSDAGGLLRFAVDTACLAFRRADGKFLSGHAIADVRGRERDRVWRYVVLLGGLLRPLGRCATCVQVVSTDRASTWNALEESLWQWQRRVEPSSIQVRWHEGVDGRPTLPASTWIAARILPSHALKYMQSADGSLPELLLRTLNGDRAGRVCEIVEEAFQAAIDQDIARRGSVQGITQAGVQIEHRLLEAIRGLCREKWTVNTPGGRLWCTEQGVFLVWKPAANDVQVRMRAQGIAGIPQDADT